MTCAAAIKHTLEALTSDDRPFDKIYARVDWWTPDTVQDAIQDLIRAQKCVAASYPDGVRYRRSKLDVAKNG